MKVTVDVDCTPEEARRFLGLPDLTPVHEAYVEKMKSGGDRRADARNVRRHDEGLGADERGGHEHVEADARPDGEGAALSDTIYALSSGAPPAAVAIVRISGPRAHAALEALARRLPAPRVATLSGSFAIDGELLDNALILWLPRAGERDRRGCRRAACSMAAGRWSRAVLAALGGDRRACARAEPGEFTRRAFENGRIDLAEAEGLGRPAEAETEAQRRAALALAGGALSRRVDGLAGRGCWRWRRGSRRCSISPTRTMSAPLPTDVGAALAALARPRWRRRSRRRRRNG